VTDITRSAADPLASKATSPFDRLSEVCRSFTAEWRVGRPDLPAYLGRVPADERPTLLRNLIEHEVRTRRRAGEAPTSDDYLAALPSEYAGLVREVFLDASSVSLAGRFDPTPNDDRVNRLPASRLGEYRLVRELGRGGMGAVFEAVHLRRGHRVALKTLPAVNADALHRFKREFRALADVTHPNLVGLRTLECDGAQWFITLDLLEGVGFLRYVRPADTLDEGRLRTSLAQLAAGVMALHARGVVHRDLKPGNVMVTSGGRVVILDFGLVGELTGESGSLAKVAGTPAYMAPEQAAGVAVGPPADWYAVGVMLYEGLSGRRPFEGKDVWELLARKQREDAPPLTADVPADLADLTMRLIARDAAARPDPLHIAGAVTGAAGPTGGPVGNSDQLVGRESQLAALADALATVRRSRSPVSTFVRGRSGEGKTSLVEAFLTPLRTDPTAVVLSGRCYDRESVPFKALDTLVDALTAHLRSLPDADAALLLPDDIGILAELFPVLRRCEVVAKAPKGRLDALDQQQVRQRGFAALRLLLDRLGERATVVLFADDLQWGDTDSAAALFEVLRPPHAPPVLFIGSYRSDEADDSPYLGEWSDRQRQNGVDLGDRAVAVGPLELDEAARLVANVVGRDDEVVRRRAVQFHAQTGGNPFLLTELAGCFDPDADAFHATDIHGVLASKLADLPADAGPLLRAVAVSWQAVELGEAAAAGGLAGHPEDTLTRMRNVRLLRVVGARVDTYHDRIRYAVLDRLGDDERKGLHRRLAEVIEQTAGGLTADEVAAIGNGADPGGRAVMGRVYDLSYHYDAAGDSPKALAYALVAATQAHGQYAQDVAAQQYTIAVRNAADAPNAVRFHIARGRGEALMQLARYDETAAEIETAATLAERPYDVADTQGMRGELASKRGLVAESIAHYESGLRTLGVHVPRTRVGLGWGIVKEALVQVAHGLFPFRLHRGSPNPESDLSNQLLARFEWSLYAHSVPKLLWASMVGLNRAQRLPRSKALAINYVVHANDMAVLGWHSRAERYYRSAIELSTELNDRWGAALGVSHFGFGSAGAARFEAAVEKGKAGREAFSKLGDMLELHLAYSAMIMGQYGLGQLRSAYETAKAMFDSCVRHGDNIIGPWAAFALVRCTGGRLPVDELFACVQVLPGNTLAASPAAMAAGYWHAHRERTAEAVVAFERAWQLCRDMVYVVNMNSSVLTDLVTALRQHTLTLPPGDERKRTRKQWHTMARWADRLSWFLPPERPRALREMALVHADRGRVRKAWKLAAKSCQVADGQKAKYEHALSLKVQGELGKRLGRPEADEQLRTSQAGIDRIEGELAAVLGGR
jgi:tetratricopeptide (TPR) repeat protein